MPKLWLTVILAFLYLSFLGRTGFLGPDEPRYASIGREMARSGDWVTPRLDGSPWFEKPPLLYWMTGVATRLRLRDEWAARLPVALASLLFLIFFFGIVEREFSTKVATSATAILATTAGWLAYSFESLPDLPMSVALDAAVFIALFDTRPGREMSKPAYAAGVLLGLAILAKGFVPLVLFVPIFLVARRKRWRIAAAAIVVAAPWYILCGMRNGHVFWNEFFWKHHIARFLTPDLQHVQPFWYYVPVLLAGLFPWTPLVILAARRRTWDDERIVFLALWAICGLVFFSVAKNKLPGYVLPLMPALAVILAVALDRAPALWSTIVFSASILLLILLPIVAGILPDALMEGLRRAHGSFTLGVAPVLLTLIAAAVSGYLVWTSRTPTAILAATLAIAVGITWFKLHAFPLLDQRASARAFWRSNPAIASTACVDPAVRRTWVYGLNYYAGRQIPDCPGSAPDRIVEHSGRLTLAQ